MKIQCVWEHNGDDSILYSSNFIGAFTRGRSKDEAIQKMPSEIISYLKWKGSLAPNALEPEIIQEKVSELTICDADSDVLFDEEKTPLTLAEYEAVDTDRTLFCLSCKDQPCISLSVSDNAANCANVSASPRTDGFQPIFSIACWIASLPKGTSAELVRPFASVLRR